MHGESNYSVGDSFPAADVGYEVTSPSNADAPESVVDAAAADSAPTGGHAESPRSPAEPPTPPAAAVAAPPPDSKDECASSMIDETLEGLLAEMQAFPTLGGTTEPSTANTQAELELAASGEPMTFPSFPEEDLEDEEADIELIKSNGIVVAKLRHPSGTEALVDLRGGLVYGWLEKGDANFTPGGPLLLWPEVLDRQEEVPSWRLNMMDDSNNEPSVTLVCEGGNFPWKVERTITLGASEIREEVSLTNLSGTEARVQVVERSYGEVLAGRVSAEPPGPLASKIPSFRRAGPLQPPLSAAVPPGGSWEKEQRWVADRPET